ncbi:MAG: DUF5916 domain-containing protein [Longimicrobiales bacterium]
MLTLLLPLQLAAGVASASGATPVYRGFDGEIAVAAPRIEAEASIDGVLDEPAWSRAAVLSNFSQYQPVDGLPADDETEVLVWYAPDGLYLGVRAREPHGAVNATLADRDRIFGDDYVQILLDPFHDGRRALVFAVNPLGVQADGTQSEEERSRSGMFTAEESSARIDLSPDYLFQSAGRVVEGGYEIEIHVPFKSLRFPPEQPQTWGINVLRRVQHAGQSQTWTPVRRGETSFLAQGGTLEGLEGIRRGLVMDLNPVLTSQTVGAPGAAGGWDYDRQASQFGVNARWGVTTDLTVNGTVNPDFSQVESDAAQIQFDPRLALSFQEKRPFFLEGAEQFSTPGGLIYTRRIVDPVAAVKLAGQVRGADVGYLAAVDDPSLSATGNDRPIYNILRVRRGVGERSTVGLTYTDRVAGADYNRVAAVDGRLVSGAYTLGAQFAGSRTRRAGDVASAPMWSLSLTRAGRERGFSVSTSGLSPDFRAGSGFISRGGVATVSITPRLTRFGAAGSALESWGTSITANGVWLYDRFLAPSPDEAKLHFNNSFVFRGGWNVGASFLLEQFRLPPGLYDGYAIDLGNDTVPFVGRPTINNYDFVLTVGTPEFPTFAVNGFVLLGRDENFAEWAPGYLLWAEMGANWRPTERVRVEGTYSETRVARPSDWSVVSLSRVPRVKVEYQLLRSVFLRMVGQYVAQEQDDLRDDGRTGLPLLALDAQSGGYAPLTASAENNLQLDWLFSYQPNPGTVLFAGYGSTLEENRAFRFDRLARTRDAFFVKLSYLFRS